MVASLHARSALGMTYTVKQDLPKQLAILPEPSQFDIRSEKNFRRATAGFVSKHGGDLARLFLSTVNGLGLVTDRSRFMCQVSPIVKGAFPSPPNWHVDRMPGSDFNLAEHLTSPVTGVIACFCSSGRIEATEFLHGGDASLVEPAYSDAVHHAGQYLNEDHGVLNWTTAQIVSQLEAGTVSSASVTPNHLYSYDSRSFHKPPQFTHDGGYRMFLRINTPPEGFPHAIATNDRVLPDSDFYFCCQQSDGRWRRYRYS